MIIKILGTGCPNCINLENNTKKALEKLSIEAVVDKVTDIGLIMNYGVMSTPALVIDEEVVSYGRVPDVKEIEEMITNNSNKVTDKKTVTNTGGCSCGGKC